MACPQAWRFGVSSLCCVQIMLGGIYISTGWPVGQFAGWHYTRAEGSVAYFLQQKRQCHLLLAYCFPACLPKRGALCGVFPCRWIAQHHRHTCLWCARCAGSCQRRPSQEVYPQNVSRSCEAPESCLRLACVSP